MVRSNYIGKVMLYDLVSTKRAQSAGSLAASDHIAISVNDSLQTAIERAADFMVKPHRIIRRWHADGRDSDRRGRGFCLS